MAGAAGDRVEAVEREQHAGRALGLERVLGGAAGEGDQLAPVQQPPALVVDRHRTGRRQEEDVRHDDALGGRHGLGQRQIGVGRHERLLEEAAELGGPAFGARQAEAPVALGQHAGEAEGRVLVGLVEQDVEGDDPRPSLGEAQDQLRGAGPRPGPASEAVETGLVDPDHRDVGRRRQRAPDERVPVQELQLHELDELESARLQQAEETEAGRHQTDAEARQAPEGPGPGGLAVPMPPGTGSPHPVDQTVDGPHRCPIAPLIFCRRATSVKGDRRSARIPRAIIRT